MWSCTLCSLSIVFKHLVEFPQCVRLVIGLTHPGYLHVVGAVRQFEVSATPGSHDAVRGLGQQVSFEFLEQEALPQKLLRRALPLGVVDDPFGGGTARQKKPAPLQKESG